MMSLNLIPETNDDMDDQTVYNLVWGTQITIHKCINRMYGRIINSIDTLAVVFYYISLYIKNSTLRANMYNIHKLILHQQLWLINFGTT